MRPSLYSFARPFAAYLTAISIAALCWLDTSEAIAGIKSPIFGLTAAMAQPPAQIQIPSSTRQTAISGARHLLGPADEIATLHAIYTALSSVGDGDAYVWRRGSGLLHATIRPTMSFRSAQGQICRHIIIRLMSGSRSRQMEGIACRDNTDTWLLVG